MTLHDLLEVLSRNSHMTLYGDGDRLIGYFDYPWTEVPEKTLYLEYCDVVGINVCRVNELCVFIEE